MLVNHHFEDLCKRIVNQEQFPRCLLLGGIIGFIPVINLILLGYFYRYSLNFRETGNLDLPDWSDWKLYLRDTVVTLGVILPYLLILWVVGLLLNYLFLIVTTTVFGVLGIGFLGEALGMLPLMATIFLSVPLALACIYTYQTRENWEDLLQWEAVFRLLDITLKPLLVPLLSFLGLQFIGFPVYGFAIFMGLTCIVPYTIALFSIALQRSN